MSCVCGETAGTALIYHSVVLTNGIHVGTWQTHTPGYSLNIYACVNNGKMDNLIYI